MRLKLLLLGIKLREGCANLRYIKNDVGWDVVHHSNARPWNRTCVKNTPCIGGVNLLEGWRPKRVVAVTI